MDTKTRILLAALRLFNRSGSAAVTTNHIAEQAGISPGNLYYHYRNKEQIVRALFVRMNVAADELWEAAHRTSLTPNDLYELFRGNMRIFSEYAFFARELPGLLQNDPSLRRTYRKLHASRIVEVERVLEALRDAGLMRGWKDRDELRLLIDGCWVQSFFWLPYLDSIGEERSPNQFARGATLVLRILAPYLADGVHDALLAMVAASIEPDA